MNSNLGESFKIAVGVRQVCLLSAILFNLFLEITMQEIFHNHHASISIDDRPICNLRFADDIAVTGRNNGNLRGLTCRLVDRGRAYEIEVRTEKSKIMANIMNDVIADVAV